MQFQTMVGIYQISISPDAERAAFEEIMRTQVFSKVAVGNQTRGGVVTSIQQKVLMRGNN